MQWQDEGYLLSKNSFDENSIIIESFTLNHGKYAGIVYGGASKKQKKIFQIGNKVSLNLKSKSENKTGYFTVELIEPVAPLFFDNKKKSICVLAAMAILKILLPERQVNKKIYTSFDHLIKHFERDDWIFLYIYWELSLIKELGFEINFLDNNYSTGQLIDKIKINDKYLKVPKLFLDKNKKNINNYNIKEALMFNKSLILENFILPNKLRIPIFRNILEKYYD